MTHPTLPLPGRVLTVPSPGGSVDVRVVHERALPALKALDDLCFGPHAGISLAQLQALVRTGAVLAVFEEDRPVALAQVALQPLLDAPEALLRSLPPGHAYRAGSAVHPAHRGRGLGLALGRAVRQLLDERGVTDSWATVRPENLPSLKNLERCGYVVVGFAAEYYASSPGSDGGRLVLWSDHRRPVGSALAGEPELRAARALLAELEIL